MTTFDDTLYFRYFFRARADKQFSTFEFVLHYLGVARIVYDTVLRRWRMQMNLLNPLAYVLVLAAFLWSGFWENGFRDAIAELPMLPQWLSELYERREDGQWRYLSYRRAFTNDETDRA